MERTMFDVFMFAYITTTPFRVYSGIGYLNWFFSKSIVKFCQPGQPQGTLGAAAADQGDRRLPVATDLMVFLSYNILHDFKIL